MFFQDQILAYAHQCYATLPDEQRQLAIGRNIGWNIDLAREQERAAEGLEIESASYEELPQEQRQHDESIQARLSSYQAGVHLGYRCAEQVISMLLEYIRFNSAKLEGEALIQQQAAIAQLGHRHLLTSVAEAAQDEGLPQFMIHQLQDTFVQALLSQVATTFTRENENGK